MNEPEDLPDVLEYNKAWGRNYWQRHCSNLCLLFQFILTTRKQNKCCLLGWALSSYLSFTTKIATICPHCLQGNVSELEICINSSTAGQLPALLFQLPSSCSHLAILSLLVNSSKIQDQILLLLQRVFLMYV